MKLFDRHDPFSAGRVTVSYVVQTTTGNKVRISGKPPLKPIKMISEKDIRETYNEAVMTLKPALEHLRPLLLKSRDAMAKSFAWMLWKNMARQIVPVSMPSPAPDYGPATP